MNRLNSTQLLDAIFKTAVDGILVIDTKGIILSTNPAVTRLFGYTNQELIGQSVNLLMPTTHARAHNGYIQNYLETEEAKIIGIGREVEGKRKDGSLFPFNLSVSQVLLDDHDMVFAGIVHDISKQKQVQEEIEQLNEILEKRIEERTEQLHQAVNRLKQANLSLRNEIHERKIVENALRESEKEAQSALELERELSELKSRFITTASHEFRTPLSTILSSAKLIARYTEKEQLDKINKHIDRIHKVVNNLNNVLDDLLSWSKMEEGKVYYSPQEFEVKEIINNLLEEAEICIKTKQKIIYTHQGEAFPVCLDPNYLTTIVLNLVNNAIKYSDPASTIQVTSKLETAFLYVEVIDQGLGIPLKDQAHLFERFFRGDNVHNIPGTGLGLNMVKKYLEVMNGSITFQSKEGKGSHFSISIPV